MSFPPALLYHTPEMAALPARSGLSASLLGSRFSSLHETFEQGLTLRSQLLGILICCLPFQGIHNAAWRCAVRLCHTLNQLAELLCKWGALFKLVQHLVRDVGSVER